MFTLSKRKLDIGIFGCIFLIIIILIRSYWSLIEPEEIRYFFVKQAILLTVYLFLYIGTIILLYTILVVHYEQNQLKGKWKLLIRLEIIGGILLILSSGLPHPAILGIYFIVRLVVIVLYLMIFSGINKILEAVVPDITRLKTAILSSYIIILLAVGLNTIDRVGKMIGDTRSHIPNLIADLILIVPFIFILLFLIKVKSNLYNQEDPYIYN
jgi:hypothetical protein